MTNFTTELTQITPELARDFLSDKYYYPFNRAVRPKHVHFLADAMEKERFDPTAQIAFACVSNEQDYLINGQHTLNAILESSIPQELNVVRYMVEIYEDVHVLFSHYDIGVNRTFADSVRAFGVADTTGLTHSQITRASAALRYMKGGFPAGVSQVKMASEDLIQLLYDWNDEALLVFNALMPGENEIKRQLRNAAVLSVFLVITKYHSSKAKEFISKVATDDGVIVGDPRKALNRYLRDTAKNTRSSSKRTVSNGQLSRSVAKCWNKHFTGISAKTINLMKGEISSPIVIKGTPYTGKFRTVG